MLEVAPPPQTSATSAQVRPLRWPWEVPSAGTAEVSDGSSHTRAMLARCFIWWRSLRGLNWCKPIWGKRPAQTFDPASSFHAKMPTPASCRALNGMLLWQGASSGGGLFGGSTGASPFGGSGQLRHSILHPAFMLRCQLLPVAVH